MKYTPLSGYSHRVYLFYSKLLKYGFVIQAVTLPYSVLVYLCILMGLTSKRFVSPRISPLREHY